MKSDSYNPYGNDSYWNYSDWNFSDFGNWSFGNFSFPFRRLSTDDFLSDPIDIMTADLYNMTDKEIQDIILGKIMYDIIALRDTLGTPLH